MPQKRVTLQLSEDQKQELIDFMDSAPSERIGIRAAIVLDCANGMRGNDVAAKYGERPNTVVLWKRRYAESGIEGLLNQPRGKSKDGYGPDFMEQLVSAVHSAPPDGAQAWSVALLARHFDIPAYGIRRYLKRTGISLEDVGLFQDHMAETSDTANLESAKPEEHAYTQEDTAEETTVEQDSEIFSEDGKTESGSTELRMKLICVCEDEEGNIVFRSEVDAGTIPDQRHFDMTSVAGFRKHLSQLEQNMINGMARLMSETAENYFLEASEED